MSQRIALAQTQLQLVQSNPELHGGPQGLYQAYRKMYEALGVTNIDQILPQPQQPQPINPKGKPRSNEWSKVTSISTTKS